MKKLRLYSCIDINKIGESSHFDLTRKEIREIIKDNKKKGFKYEKLGKGIVTYI